MPKNKQLVRGGTPLSRIRPGSGLMRTHESIVDLMNGRSSGGIFGALTPAILSLHFSQNLEDDLIYSDEDDSDYDEEDEDCRPPYASKKTLEPHPQIKQLTEEEADRIAKELIDEEDRRKGRTERNKRKKKRKKEKKRLEKESAPKENVPADDENKLDSSENQEQTCIIDNSEEDKPQESGESQAALKEAECAELAEKDNKERNATEEEQNKHVNLNNLNVESTKLIGEKCHQKSKNEKKQGKNQVDKIERCHEEKIHVVKNPEVQKENKNAISNEKIQIPVTEDVAKRSVELASMGNRLASSGEYDMAVSCFTDAIKYNPKEFKLFGNRSLCYERLGQYENALRDADLALSMQPNWIKGLFRKGKALCGLKRYYEASLIYRDVLELESTSAEAVQELKRAQTLHLMELGFSWAQCTEALRSHATFEKAVEALFASDSSKDPGGAYAIWGKVNRALAPEDDAGDWTVQQTSRPRSQQFKDLHSVGQSRTKSQSPTPNSRNSTKPELFSVWVGTLGPNITYVRLHELLSRAGTVHSIKMLLEQQCAFVNYTQKEDCERAIQCINGMELEGAPLTVRYPFKSFCGYCEPFQRSSPFKKECFFWRTTGCTREDCTYRHIPEHKNIDRDKFTDRLGFSPHAGNQK